MSRATPSAQARQRILLVDDDEDDYILTREMLVDSGRDKFTLDWAPAYQLGLEQLLSTQYAAALIDYDLGEKKGTELIETALARGCQTPMIVYTGRGSYEIDVLAMHSGAADYINKAEATPALLERSIRYAIERKHTEQALQTALAEAEGGWRMLEAVMNNVPVGIILTGGPPDFRIKKVSRYVVELTGRPLHSLTGLRVGRHQDNWRLLLADGRTRPAETDVPLYRAAFLGQVTKNQEMVLIGARGRRLSILASAAPIRDRHGQIVAAIGVFHDITDRKQIEQALHLSEERFRLASRATAGVVYDWNLETDEIYESEAMLKVVGYHPGETKQRGGRRWWPANIHPEDSERVQRSLQAALDGTSDSIAYEYRIRHLDGHWVEIWDQSYIVRNEQGKAVRLVGTCTDISERKRWEARTRQQNAVLDAINRIFQEALSASSEEALGLTCLTVVQELTQSPLGFIGEVGAANRTGEDAGTASGWIHCEQCLSQVQDHGPTVFEPHGLLAQVLNSRQSVLDNAPDGLPPEHIPLTAFLGVPLIQAGETIGVMAVGNRPGGYTESERESLEALAPAVLEALARKRAELALRESEERFRIALANAPVVIFTMDRELRYTWIYNPRSDTSVEETIGKRDEDLLDANSARLITEIKQQVLSSGQGTHREVSFQLQGKPVIYDLTIEPLRDEGGQVTGLIAAAMDITRARQIETEMRSAADRLEIQRQILQQREQERMQIARDMHDGLLQELIGLTYMLREGLELTDKAERSAKFSEIMAALQAQIADIRTFCANLRPPTLIPFGLERAINQFAAIQMEKHPEPVIELDLMKDGRMLPEDLRVALFRIMQESVNNARKHAKAQRVNVRFAFDEEEVVLEVRDDGVGFEVPENWLRLSRSGHLGLVGIHERAEAVGGRLQVISAPGQGTRVLVTVPRKDKP